MHVRFALVAAFVLAGCGGGFRTTLLETAEAGQPAPEYRVSIPDGYEVMSVDYDAALVGFASGDSSGTSTTLGGKGVLSVYAVERATQQRVVFVYDDVRGRATPTAVIRLSEDG